MAIKKNYIITFFTLFILQSCTQREETILFSSSRNGNSDVFIMDADGNNQMALTDSAAEEWGPTWINAAEISFLRQNKDSIYRIKLNLTTKEESILEHPPNCILDDKNVLYSPYNQYQLYLCQNNIFIQDLKGNTRNITEHLSGRANYPSWSNDAQHVIYTSNHLGSKNIFMYDVDTEKTTQLTDTDSNNERGELSPDNKHLVFSSDYFENGNQEIVVQNLKTNAIENISNSPGMELIGRFSNDGQTLYFGSNKDGNWEIYAYDFNTKNQIRLTNNTAFDGDPRVLKR